MLLRYFRVGQNRIYTPYMTVYLVIPCPKCSEIPYMYKWFWPTLRTYDSSQPYTQLAGITQRFWPTLKKADRDKAGVLGLHCVQGKSQHQQKERLAHLFMGLSTFGRKYYNHPDIVPSRRSCQQTSTHKSCIHLRSLDLPSEVTLPLNKTMVAHHQNTGRDKHYAQVID